MNLRDIVLNYLTDNEKGMQQLITWFLNDVMNEEVAQQAGVPRHARSSSRRAHRNGYRSRSLKTRYGELILQKPQLREIPFETKVFERYSRTEKALVNAIIESYLQGVNQISAPSVSKVARELDVKVTEFMERTIDSHIPYLYVDASYFKVRDGVKYVNKALLVVVGVRTDGYREILAARVADAEHELTWEGMFSDLKERGLTREVSPKWISSSLMVIPESSPQLGKCSRAPHGRCAMYTSSGQFSEKSLGNITKRSLRL